MSFISQPEYQEEKFEVDDLKIMEYNQDVENWNRSNPDEKKRKVSGERIKRVLLMLKQHSLDELVTLGAISRRTKYNYKKDIGNLNKSSDVGMLKKRSGLINFNGYFCNPASQINTFDEVKN